MQLSCDAINGHIIEDDPATLRSCGLHDQTTLKTSLSLLTIQYVAHSDSPTTQALGDGDLETLAHSILQTGLLVQFVKTKSVKVF